MSYFNKVNVAYSGTPITASTPLPIRNNYVDVIFHTTEATPTNGTSFVVGSYKTLTVEIYGSANTVRLITFYRKQRNGTLKAIQGINTATYAVATSTTGTDEEWQFDVTGRNEIIMDITSMTGGTITIKGTAVT